MYRINLSVELQELFKFLKIISARFARGELDVFILNFSLKGVKLYRNREEKELQKFFDLKN